MIMRVLLLSLLLFWDLCQSTNLPISRHNLLVTVLQKYTYVPHKGIILDYNQMSGDNSSKHGEHSLGQPQEGSHDLLNLTSS